MTDKQVERIVKTANTKRFIKECEPNVCYHFPVEAWMVERIIPAYKKVVKE